MDLCGELHQERKRHVSFRELLGAGHTKMQMVITFLVILELMKMGKISIVQETYL